MFTDVAGGCSRGGVFEGELVMNCSSCVSHMPLRSGVELACAKPYQISVFTVITVQWATTVNCVFVEGQPGLQTSLLCYRGDLEQWGDCLLPQRRMT